MKGRDQFQILGVDIHRAIPSKCTAICFVLTVILVSPYFRKLLGHLQAMMNMTTPSGGIAAVTERTKRRKQDKQATNENKKKVNITATRPTLYAHG